ncbi:UDP-N-acetylmuramate dehydrogenase [Neptunomonas antarctica]|uniref:UDP-N-acetylenolpyruvoylglucosamine reductase n=1 Tax=Neptunomonas antarctica TaxID=619304 RepID=A0A1N7KAP4_9GAMM|nr:UDP-N-acetylmuramate dehydrogenase [Neptunomonas antarctica]SIS58609.1 UDP-N-acetylmuramate dehydrogenase [Neptunomonas antarctica]
MDIQHKLQSNFGLQSSNTLKFPAIAEYFIAVASEAELVSAVTYAKQHHLPIRILGGGSNVLMAPQIDGLVIRIDIMGQRVFESGDSVSILLGGGENWHETVRWSVERGLSGIESMALIPGRVGASPVQNIGAYGTELKDVLRTVRAYHVTSGRFVELSNSECQFAYRDSLFKHFPGEYIITEVELQLFRQQDASIRYAALQNYFDQQHITQPGVQQVFDAVCAVRRSKLPDPEILANAGSFFKNPVISEQQHQFIKQQWPNLIAYPDRPGFMKLAAGWLIDQCDWKGKGTANVGVYDKQALVLVHFGGGQLTELLQLAGEIQASVYVAFDVQLEIEPQAFPFN